MKKLFALCFLFLLAGCNSMPKQVSIPLAVKPPAPTIPSKPQLPIAKLTEKSRPDEVIKAYAASVVLLQGYSDRLIKILKVYQ